jgi:glycosyltransferase involved in cell wall biosynthesis
MLRQPGAEVVVVDYGCPDRAGDHVEARHPAARVVRTGPVEGFNPSRARNLGAAAAEGDTLVFVDADVVLADGFLAFLAASLAPDAYAKPRDPQTLDENSVQGTCVVHRSHFDLVGGYDEVLVNYGGEDLELYDRLVTARLQLLSLPPELFARVIPHGAEDRERFFDTRAETGFMVGKVYRIAKDMMIRLNGTFDVDLATRRQLYDEIARLVRNMDRMREKGLTLEVKFPDGNDAGLHRHWSFLRSIKVTVDRR